MLRITLAGVSALALSAVLRAVSAQAQPPQAPAPQAEAQPEAETLPGIVVAAPAPGSPTVPSVEQQRRALNRTAGSVGFVDEQDVRGRLSNTLRDVLKDTPGVLVQTRYGQELRLSVRGSGIGRGFHLRGIELLQDGIPVNLADGSGDFNQIDPLALRSVESYRGGNGLAYGSSAQGGAVNFVTPTARTAAAPALLRLDGGSFATVRLNAQASGSTGAFDGLANVTATRSDGFRDHARQRGFYLNANAGYRVAPGAETRFYVGAYVVDQQIPGALTLRDALRRPRGATQAALAGDQKRDTWTQRVANRTTVTLGAGQLDLDAWFIHKRLFHPIFQVLDEDGITYGAAPRLTASFTVAGLRNDLVVGGRVFGGDNRALRFTNVRGSRGARTLDARQRALNLSAYAENRLHVLPGLAVVAGVKVLRDERRYRTRALTAGGRDTSPSRTYEGINPRLGLLWEPRQDVQVFANITRSQDVPDFSDLVQTQVNGSTGFVPLAAQRAYTVELGTRGRLDRLAWDVTLFRSLIRGQLLQFSTDPVNIPASTFNAGRTVNQGVEFGAALDLVRDALTPGDRLTLSQVWTYNDFKFRDDRQYGRNRIAGQPPHVLRTTLAYAGSNGLRVAPSVDWVPTGAFADYANTLRAPGYATFGIEAGIEPRPGASLFLDARNLTNVRYVSDLSTVTDARRAPTAVFQPGDGRSLYGGVRVAF